MFFGLSSSSVSTAFASAFASLLFNETDEFSYFAPMNEISFLAWGAGDHGILHPFATSRGLELKCQLVSASISAMDAIRNVNPHARFVQVDPLINVVTDPDASEEQRQTAAGYTRAQFDAFDMLSGHLWPQLGGHPDYLDIIGANYYVHNQWVFDGEFIERTDPRYRPLHELLGDLYRVTVSRFSLRRPGLKMSGGPNGFRTSPMKSSSLLRREYRSKAFAFTRSSIIPDGTMSGIVTTVYGTTVTILATVRSIYPLADELRRQTARIESVLRRLQPEPRSWFSGSFFTPEEASAGAALSVVLRSRFHFWKRIEENQYEFQ